MRDESEPRAQARAQKSSPVPPVQTRGQGRRQADCSCHDPLSPARRKPVAGTAGQRDASCYFCYTPRRDRGAFCFGAVVAGWPAALAAGDAMMVSLFALTSSSPPPLKRRATPKGGRPQYADDSKLRAARSRRAVGFGTYSIHSLCGVSLTWPSIESHGCPGTVWAMT